MQTEPLALLDKHHRNPHMDFEKGCLLLVNKPLEWTSFDVVNKIKYAIKYSKNLKKIKVGHAGTLDPMAEGLLLVCTGKYTKMLDSMSRDNKAYRAVMKIGATTPCYDREAAEENHKDISHITQKDIENLAIAYDGWQQQVPPVFSAIKIKGQSAYSLARRGEDIELKSREVHISDIQFIDISLPFVTFDVSVSKGTYIRSLANDMGKSLHTGAYLYHLVRTRIGSYLLEDALELDEIVELIKRENHP